LKTIADPISKLRGALKESTFNTQTYIEQKKLDKELEDE
jgi:hypothetical protein